MYKPSIWCKVQCINIGSGEIFREDIEDIEYKCAYMCCETKKMHFIEVRFICFFLNCKIYINTHCYYNFTHEIRPL
jgi:hypothetical protein